MKRILIALIIAAAIASCSDNPPTNSTSNSADSSSIINAPGTDTSRSDSTRGYTPNPDTTRQQ